MNLVNRNTPAVKICGLRDTDIADAIAQGSLYPDYVGFVFAPSRRQVSVEQARELSLRVSFAKTKIAKVGVFVDASYQSIITAAKRCELDILQLHGSEPAEMCKELKNELQGYGIKIWRSYAIGAPSHSHVLESLLECKGMYDGVLLDTYHPKQAGGTGRTFDWNHITQMRQVMKTNRWQAQLIVAGGISVDNVEALLAGYQPDTIDVSSGIEAIDGNQDYQKIKTLLEKVKAV